MTQTPETCQSPDTISPKPGTDSDETANVALIQRCWDMAYDLVDNYSGGDSKHFLAGAISAALQHVATSAAPTLPADVKGLETALAEFDQFINEPTEFEDETRVRDYRHQLYRKWSPLARALTTPSSSDRVIDRVAQAIRDNIQASLPDGLSVDFNYAARAAFAASRLIADMEG